MNPELQDYLTYPERYPHLQVHPGLGPGPTPMVREPESLSALFAPQQFDEPSPVPGSEINAPGRAFSSLVEQGGPFEGDYSATEEPRRGLEPLSAMPGQGYMTTLHTQNDNAAADAAIIRAQREMAHQRRLAMDRERLQAASAAQAPLRRPGQFGRYMPGQADIGRIVDTLWGGFQGAVRDASSAEIERRRRARQR